MEVVDREESPNLKHLLINVFRSVALHTVVSLYAGKLNVWVLVCC